MKYKVGERYIIPEEFSTAGNVIEITEVDRGRVAYKTIIEKKKDYICRFDIGSVLERNLKPYNENETIIVYRSGNEVIALNKETKEKAVAKCCPEDEFDFKTGAKLAFTRLLGIELEEKIKIGDLVTVVDDGCLYSTYADYRGFGKWKQNWVLGSNLSKGGVYRLLNIAKHHNGETDVALIQNESTTQVFVIGLEGLEKDYRKEERYE